MGLKTFNYYICVSNYIKDLLNSEGILGKKYVVFNGMDLCEKPLKSKEDIRASLGIPMDAFVYIMISRLHPVKNHIRLINAFNKLHNEHKDTRLILVGEGPMEEELKALAGDGVIFTGFKKEVLDYINASDISVLSSLSEGGAPPLVILESAVVKKSAIVSRVCDLPNIINDKNGFLFDPNSEEDIYLKLKEGYNKENLIELGEALHNDVIDNFSMEKFCTRYFSSYKSIIEDYNGISR